MNNEATQPLNGGCLSGGGGVAGEGWDGVGSDRSRGKRSPPLTGQLTRAADALVKRTVSSRGEGASRGNYSKIGVADGIFE